MKKLNAPMLLRKKNVVFATQSLAELETHPPIPAILESCAIKIPLAVRQGKGGPTGTHGGLFSRSKKKLRVLALLLGAFPAIASASADDGSNGVVVPPAGQAVTQAQAEQYIQNLNRYYQTPHDFQPSSADQSNLNRADQDAQAAGQQYDQAVTNSRNAAIQHRQSDASTAESSAAGQAASSMAGPIANHEAMGNQYDQDAANAEVPVCGSTNKKGQCTSWYDVCESTCQYYQGLANQQFQLAAEDRGQQSAMQGQSQSLNGQARQQQARHVTDNAQANAQRQGGNAIDQQGGSLAASTQAQENAEATDWGKRQAQAEVRRIQARMRVPAEQTPYTLPTIPTLSANTLIGPVKAEVEADQAKANTDARNAMRYSHQAALDYRQYQAYLRAEAQAKAQARQDEANAASAPTPSSRAAWSAAAARMMSKANADAQSAAAEKARYMANRREAEKLTQTADAIAAQAGQLATRSVEKAANSQIQPYLQ